MMAQRDEYTYRGNLVGKPKLLWPGYFAAGSSARVYQGGMMIISTITWANVTTDDSRDSVVGVAETKVESGDAAGYYPVIVPQAEDQFEFDFLSTDTQTIAFGTDLYLSTGGSDSFRVTSTAGTGVIAQATDTRHYPRMQGHAAHDASFDRGSTVGSIASICGGKILVSFTPAASYYTALFPVA